MKKIFAFFAAIIFMFTTNLSANALIRLADVNEDHWAVQEIVTVINGGVMGVTSDGYFHPDEVMTRADFTQTLLRLLGHRDNAGYVENVFTDVPEDFYAYSDILKSQALGLIYGYGDGTFRPLNNISKSEVESIISHITEDTDYIDTDVLDVFTDKDDIPAWALERYAKAVSMGVYVNHPDPDTLLPNKLLTRAECAVLLYKLRDALNNVKKEFVAEEQVMSIDHLDISPDAKTNEVKITNFRKIILAGNVLKVYFAENFASKRYVDGTEIKFINVEDIITEEGNMLIPAQSQFIGRVSSLIKQRAFNQNAKVGIEITKVILPNGEQIDFSAQTVKDLRPSKAATFGKVAAYTVGGAAVGSGIGIAASAGSGKYGTGIAVGLPVGAGVGLATGLLTPGLQYKGHVGDPVYVELLSDLVIRN
ncbi:MAG: S-layer homology domain-containing protein [Candidatus Gastranaerophilales bacterium]|nr:S-layer homology domain-containing protein [Candidatus Gastranaerophilales bacterium]